MDQIIDIKRFWNLLLKSLVQYKSIYIRIGLICLATFLLLTSFSAYFDVSNMGFYNTMINFIIVISPAAFFFKKRTHTSHFFDFILPASVLEKFLVKLLICILIFPTFIISISFLFMGIAKIIPIEAVNNVATQAYTTIINGTINQYWNLIAVQSIFLCGSYFFKNSVFGKTFLVMMGIFVTTMIMIAGIGYIMLNSSFDHSGLSGKSPADLFETSGYFLKSLLYIIQYFIPVGLWFASFYKLKETEI